MRKGKGDSAGALADYDRAIELDPDDPLAYFNRGVLKREMGAKEGALADFTQASAIDPDLEILLKSIIEKLEKDLDSEKE